MNLSHTYKLPAIVTTLEASSSWRATLVDRPQGLMGRVRIAALVIGVVAAVIAFGVAVLLTVFRERSAILWQSAITRTAFVAALAFLFLHRSLEEMPRWLEEIRAWFHKCPQRRRIRTLDDFAAPGMCYAFTAAAIHHSVLLRQPTLIWCAMGALLVAFIVTIVPLFFLK